MQLDYDAEVQDITYYSIGTSAEEIYDDIKVK